MGSCLRQPEYLIGVAQGEKKKFLTDHDSPTYLFFQKKKIDNKKTLIIFIVTQ